MSVRALNPRADGHSEAGTTLLELLLALSLVAVMLTMIFGSFGFGRRAWEAADRVEDQSSIDAVQSLLRQLLSEARPAKAIDGSGRQTIAFKGEAQSITFVVNLRGTTTTGGLHEVRLGLAGAEAGQPEGRFVAAFALYRPGPSPVADRPDKAPEERLLADGVRSLTLRYFGAAKLGDKPQWHERWADAETLPQLIEVAVDLEADDPRRWPLLLVRPELR